MCFKAGSILEAYSNASLFFHLAQYCNCWTEQMGLMSFILHITFYSIHGRGFDQTL